MKKKGKGFFAEFKAFISRGNILDLAVGVIIGGAFSAIVTAFTNSIIRPIINLILAALVGGDGLDAVYTFLKKVWIDPADHSQGVDLAKSIYIDWGAFITAVIDFLIIALVLFTILKIAMGAEGYLKNAKASRPTKEEKAVLREQGVNMKDHKAVLAATAELREKNKPAPEPPKPTQEELLTQILAELKKQNELVCECGEECNCHEKKEEKPAKKERKKKAE